MHTSPDYVAGVVHYRNGVRGIYDCGAGAPDVPEVDSSKEQKLWWRKARMGARPWLARAKRDYARMLRARDEPGDSERAERLEG